MIHIFKAMKLAMQLEQKKLAEAEKAIDWVIEMDQEKAIAEAKLYELQTFMRERLEVQMGDARESEIEAAVKKSEERFGRFSYKNGEVKRLPEVKHDE